MGLHHCAGSKQQYIAVAHDDDGYISRAVGVVGMRRGAMPTHSVGAALWRRWDHASLPRA